MTDDQPDHAPRAFLRRAAFDLVRLDNKSPEAAATVLSLRFQRRIKPAEVMSLVTEEEAHCRQPKKVERPSPSWRANIPAAQDPFEKDGERLYPSRETLNDRRNLASAAVKEHVRETPPPKPEEEE